ncbi:hypothetical protein EV360DRAFT_69644 [Lentinula raphanica]|nr:hypothetical protein EV360DRAFT_69644 [Lentinula raphanica]
MYNYSEAYASRTQGRQENVPFEPQKQPGEDFENLHDYRGRRRMEYLKRVSVGQNLNFRGSGDSRQKPRPPYSVDSMQIRKMCRYVCKMGAAAQGTRSGFWAKSKVEEANNSSQISTMPSSHFNPGPKPLLPSSPKTTIYSTKIRDVDVKHCSTSSSPLRIPPQLPISRPLRGHQLLQIPDMLYPLSTLTTEDDGGWGEGEGEGDEGEFGGSMSLGVELVHGGDWEWDWASNLAKLANKVGVVVDQDESVYSPNDGHEESREAGKEGGNIFIMMLMSRLKGMVSSLPVSFLNGTSSRHKLGNILAIASDWSLDSSQSDAGTRTTHEED